MSDFIVCVRNKIEDRNAFGSKAGGVLYLNVPQSHTTPAPSHSMPLTAWNTELRSQTRALPNSQEGREDIVFMVHGYNVGPENALMRQRLVESGLNQRGFAAKVIGFDWPTYGSTIAYVYDREQALATASQLVKAGITVLARLSRPDCPVNIHILAHSMGAFVVREAFRQADKSQTDLLNRPWRVAQVAFAGADLSSRCFAVDQTDMQALFQRSGRLTNYFSGHDAALKVSSAKNIDISSRVGRVGMPEDIPTQAKALDVDCTRRYEDGGFPNLKELPGDDGMVSHSWYFHDQNWLTDLALTLAGDLDRDSIPTRQRIGTNDYRLL